MKIFSVGVLALLVFTLACGGGNGGTTPVTGVSGAYEFVVTSNVTGGTTLVEANLAANGNQSGASGPSQAQVLTFEKKTWYVNGVCAGSTPGQNQVTATLGGNDNMALTFDEGGDSVQGQGSLIGTTISGNYSEQGSSCPDLSGILGFPTGFDSGGFIGNPVPDLAGSFSGVLNLPEGAENAVLTLQENTDHTLNVVANLAGIGETGSFAFSGYAIGNVMLVSGSANGRDLSWLGYFDSTGQFTGTARSMLIFDNVSLANAGLLLKQ